MDRQEGDSACVRGLEERCWMRFLKGMVTDHNNASRASKANKRMQKYTNPLKPAPTIS
jgi:hypothetical protein